MTKLFSVKQRLMCIVSASCDAFHALFAPPPGHPFLYGAPMESLRSPYGRSSVEGRGGAVGVAWGRRGISGVAAAEDISSANEKKLYLCLVESSRRGAFMLHIYREIDA